MISEMSIEKEMQQLEELTLNALPALQTMYVDGWVLRFSKGCTKRANSVIPLYRLDEKTIEDHIKLCEAIYRKQNLPTTFKVFDMKSMQHLEACLIERGYKEVGEVSVQVAPLKQVHHSLSNDVYLTSCRELTDDWLRYFALFNDLPANERHVFQQMLHSIVPKTNYVLMKDKENDSVIACGLAVLQNDYVGLYDIVTNPSYRQKGYGKMLVSSLLHWGLEHGAKHAYLQVLTDNEPALALYEQLGFQESYTYSFRVSE